MNRPSDDAKISTIRPFVADDAERVANLFQIVMKSSQAPASAALIDYFIAHYLEGPFVDPDIPSLIYVDPDGTIDGFAGANVQPMLFDGKTIRAVIAGNLMVRDHKKNPMAGARLIRQILTGPQDVTLSETASDETLAMWRQLHGAILDRHSLEYVRVLRPAEFGLDLIATRLGAVRVLMPLMRLVDRAAVKKDEQVRWTGLPLGFKPKAGLVARPVAPEAFADYVKSVLARDAAVPVWSSKELGALVAEAMDKPGWGKPHLCETVTHGGKRIGGFLMHFAGAGPARVVDLFYEKGQAGPVLDAVFIYARDLGATAVEGRTNPVLLNALLNRRVVFSHESASIIDTKHPALLEAFEAGRVHFTGLVGERWTRFTGGGFPG